MTTHTIHPDIEDAGLDDSCPRCQEHVLHPENSLDTGNLHRLLDGRLITASDHRAQKALLAYLDREVRGEERGDLAKRLGWPR